MKSVKSILVLSLVIGAVSPSAFAIETTSHMVIENQTFSPALQLDGTKWLVNIVTIKGLERYTVVAMHIPCITTHSSAGVYRRTKVSSHAYKNYGCTAQVIPTGPYKGLLVDQFGQIFAKPPQ
jgi:hypothetical protein